LASCDTRPGIPGTPGQAAAHRHPVPTYVPFPCRYTWKVPRDLATVTCPRRYTSQPAAHASGYHSPSPPSAFLLLGINISGTVDSKQRP
jgi:hypothetical protein